MQLFVWAATLLLAQAAAHPDIAKLLRSDRLGDTLRELSKKAHAHSKASDRIAMGVGTLGLNGAAEFAVELQKDFMRSKLREDGGKHDQQLRKAVCEFTVCPILKFAVDHGRRASLQAATILARDGATKAQKLTVATTAQFSVLGLLEASRLLTVARSEDGKHPCECSTAELRVTADIVDALIDDLLPLSGAQILETLSSSAVAGETTALDVTPEQFTLSKTLAAVSSKATLDKSAAILAKYKEEGWGKEAHGPLIAVLDSAGPTSSRHDGGDTMDAVEDTIARTGAGVAALTNTLELMGSNAAGLHLGEVAMVVSIAMSFRHALTIMTASHAEDKIVAAKKLGMVFLSILKGVAIGLLTSAFGSPVFAIGAAAFGLATQVFNVASVSTDADYVLSGQLAGMRAAMESIHQRNAYLRIVCTVASRAVTKLGPLASTTFDKLAPIADELRTAIQVSCLEEPGAHGTPADIASYILGQAAERTSSTGGMNFLYTESDAQYRRRASDYVQYDIAGKFLNGNRGGLPSSSVTPREQRNRCFFTATSAEHHYSHCPAPDTTFAWPAPEVIHGLNPITEVVPYVRSYEFPTLKCDGISGVCGTGSKSVYEYLTPKGLHNPASTEDVSEVNFCTYCARDALQGVQLKLARQQFAAPVIRVATIDWGRGTSTDTMLPEDYAGLFRTSYFEEVKIFRRRGWEIKRTADLNHCLQAQNEGSRFGIACRDHTMVLAVRKQFERSPNELDADTVSMILSFTGRLDEVQADMRDAAAAAAAAPAAAAPAAAAPAAEEESLLQIDSTASKQASFRAFDTDSDGTISARDALLALENAGSFAVHKLLQRLEQWLTSNKLEEVHGVGLSDYMSLDGPGLTPDELLVLTNAHQSRDDISLRDCEPASSRVASANPASEEAPAPGSQPIVSVSALCEAATLVTDLNRDCAVDLGDIAAGIREHEELEAVRPLPGIKLTEEDLERREIVSLGIIANVPKSVQFVAETVGLTEEQPFLPADDFRKACLSAVGGHAEAGVSPEEYRRTRVLGLFDMSRAHARTVETTLGGNLEALVHPDVWPVLDKQWALYAGVAAKEVSLKSFTAIRAVQIPDVADMEAVVRYDFEEHFKVAEENILTRAEFFAAFVRDARMRPGWENGVSEWKKEALIATMDLATARALAMDADDDAAGAASAQGGTLAASVDESTGPLHVTEEEYKQHCLGVLARAFKGIVALAPGSEDGTAKVPPVEGADLLLPGVSAVLATVCAPDCKPGAAATRIRDGLLEGKSVGEYPALWRVQAFAFSVTATAAQVSAAERAADESVLRKNQRAVLFRALQAFEGPTLESRHMSRESANVVSQVALGKTLEQATTDAGRLPKPVSDSLSGDQPSVALSALLHLVTSGVARSISSDGLDSSQKVFLRAMAGRGLAHELTRVAQRLKKIAGAAGKRTPNLRASAGEPARGSLEPPKGL